MKYLITVLLLVGCNNKPVVATKAIVHYPIVVYNNWADVYAVMTDSDRLEGHFFGKLPPPRQTIGLTTYFGTSITITNMSGYNNYYNNEPLPPPPPPSLIAVNQLRDTLKFTTLGGEFQFKDSITALQKYASFVKECKDSEDIVNAPIKIQIKHYWDSANAKHFKDSVAGRKQFVIDSTAQSKAHIEDSIFKCRHTYIKP